MKVFFHEQTSLGNSHRAAFLQKAQTEFLEMEGPNYPIDGLLSKPI